MSLIKEYFELTNQYINEYGKNTILLMQVGSFFEVYGINNAETESITGSRIEDFQKFASLILLKKIHVLVKIMLLWLDLRICKLKNM